MPSFSSLRNKLSQHRLTSYTAWRDRLLMWIAAAISGLFVVGFTYLTDTAVLVFSLLQSTSSWLPFLITPSGAIFVVWATRKFAPGSAGSGIPQVIAGMEAPEPQKSEFVSLKLSCAKMLLGALALASGFSTGREGPSVQIAAGVMHSFRNWFSDKAHINSRDLMLAGGAAGIAAAFNAPLAGVVFAIEELSRRFEQRSSGVILTAIMIGGVVSISIQGNFTYFGRLNIANLNLAILLPAVLCAIAAGMLGGLFSRLLVLSSSGTADCFSRFRQQHPIWFAGACGLAIAILGFVSQGAAHGSGYLNTREVLAGKEVLPFAYVVIKFLSTWISYWCGVPGGIFAPSLAIGAGLGNDVAILFHQSAAAPLIAIGMVGFLAAVTQAPITSFIIVMEMIDGHAMVLSLIAAALVSTLVSRAISPPLYHSLARLQLKHIGKEMGNSHHI